MDTLAHVVPIIALILGSLIVLGIIILLFPYRSVFSFPRTRTARIDERNIPFSRCCLLRPEHFYTVRGRNHYYGSPVESSHTHAMAFVVEMDHRFTSNRRGMPGYERYK